MLNDSVVFVALDHADLEEAAILLVSHGLEYVLVGVAIVLRPLDQCDLRRSKQRQGATQPEGFNLIIAIDDGNVGCVRVGQLERLVERTRLESRHVVVMLEPETSSQCGATRLHRKPSLRIRRIVVQY